MFHTGEQKRHIELMTGIVFYFVFFPFLEFKSNNYVRSFTQGAVAFTQ